MPHNPIDLAMNPKEPDKVNDRGVKWWELNGAQGDYHPWLVEFPNKERSYVVLRHVGGGRTEVVHETPALDAMASFIETRILVERHHPETR